MDVLKTMVINVPLMQILIFVILCTIVALAGKLKFLIVCVYGAVLYWVFILNEPKFGATESSNVFYTGLFIFTCMIFIGLAAWVLFVER